MYRTRNPRSANRVTSVRSLVDLPENMGPNRRYKLPTAELNAGEDILYFQLEILIDQILFDRFNILDMLKIAGSHHLNPNGFKFNLQISGGCGQLTHAPHQDKLVASAVYPQRHDPQLKTSHPSLQA